MRTVNIRAARIQFSRLVAKAAAGEEITITKAGKPVARLVGLSPGSALPKRRSGGLAGAAAIPPKFDGPLPDSRSDPSEGR